MTAATRFGRKVLNVQALRAIAALMVLGAHLPAAEKRFAGGTPYFGFLSLPGTWGVDLFFVVSGFVIVTSAWRKFGGGTPARLDFIARRFLRIYPLYWLLLIPISILAIWQPWLVNGSQAQRPSILASFLLLPQIGKPLLTVSWTLVFEVYFYAVFAAFVGWQRRFAPLLLGAWGLFTVVMHVAFPQPANPYLAHLCNTISLEFILGAAVGWAFASDRKLAGGALALGLGVAGIVFAAFAYPRFDDAYALHGGLRCLAIGLPMAAILYGSVALEVRGRFRFPQPLVRLGDASYSLYLFHVPVMIALGRIAQGTLATNPGLHVVWLVLLIVAILSCSLACYYYVEKPLLKAMARGLARIERGTFRLPGMEWTQHGRNLRRMQDGVETASAVPRGLAEPLQTIAVAEQS
jgi:peptidoglycan/LPS O-acetylase OafA/YrhL